MTDLVVTGARCVATMDDARRELAGGWVAITDGLIEQVGTGAAPPAATVIDATDCLVTPGLVNTPLILGPHGLEQEDPQGGPGTERLVMILMIIEFSQQVACIVPESLRSEIPVLLRHSSVPGAPARMIPGAGCILTVRQDVQDERHQQS